MAQRVRSMQLELATTPVAVYEAKFEENGGIVEERIVGEEPRAPASNSEYSGPERRAAVHHVINFSAARAGRAISAASSRPTRPTRD